ncbi:MAG: hypothetical protein IKD04_04875 [Clostridia bacterium]|nr:hypothetical protein [Clostridia bacterium]
MHIKKLLSVILSLVLFMGIMPLNTVATDTSISGITGDCIWSLDGTILTISPTLSGGDMADYDEPTSYESDITVVEWENQPPWYEYDITEILILEGVTHIGSYAFNSKDYIFEIYDNGDCPGCHNILPDSFDEFTYCDVCLGTFIPYVMYTQEFTSGINVSSIIIPSTATSIGENAFIGADVTFIYGASSDGELTTADLDYIMKALVGICEYNSALDYNGDCVIDTKDYVQLKKYLSGAGSDNTSSTGDTVLLSVSNEDITSADTSVTVSVDISNNPGIMVLLTEIQFDSGVFSFVGYGGSSDIFDDCIVDYSDNSVTVLSVSNDGNKTKDGRVLFLTFDVISSTAGTYPFEIIRTDISDYNEMSVIAQTTDGNVTITTHTHSFGNWRTTTTADCVNNGSRVRTCTDCGYIETETISALGHEYSASFTIDTKATCTATGSKSRHCLYCTAKTDITEIPSTAHNYNSIITPPTCTEKGYTTHTCPDCGKKLIDSYVDALGHSYSEWQTVTEPTCTVKGTQSRTCSACGDVQTKAISATGHNLKTRYTCVTECPLCADNEFEMPHDGCVYYHLTYFKNHCTDCDYSEIYETIYPTATVVAPTCTEQGYTIEACQYCDYAKTYDYTEATNHSYSEWKIIIQATCTENGIKRQLCSACGDIKTEVISATGHNYTSVVTAPTCTAQGYTTHTCSGCGYSYIDGYVDATSHSFETRYECVTEYNGDNALDCSKYSHSTYLQQYCTVCSYVADKQFVGYPPKTVIQPTCTEHGYTIEACQYCDYSYSYDYTDTTKHGYGEWQTVTPSTCTAEGTQNRTCSACGNTETAVIGKLDHEYSFDFTVDTQATCGASGSKSRHCLHCEAKTDITEIPALSTEHDYTVSILEPTPYLKGGTLHTCTVCGNSFIDNETEYFGGAAIRLSPVTAVAGKGKLVKVKAYIENNPGIIGFKLGIKYDKDVLTLQNAEVNSHLGGISYFEESVVWFSLNGRDVKYNGEAILLTFVVNTDAPVGETVITLTYSDGDIGNTAEENVDFAIIPTVITVEQHTPGDINGDGVFNMHDITRLYNYLARVKDTEVNYIALDTNNDGYVNNKDLIRLVRAYAGDSSTGGGAEAEDGETGERVEIY